MATTLTDSRPGLDPAAPVTVADLLARLGGLNPRRVRLLPTPGTATENELVLNNDSNFHTALCELVDRTLVEKSKGYEEAEISCLLIMHLNLFVRPRNLGILLDSSGMYRLRPGLVRLPDVSFFTRDRFPGGRRTKGPILDFAPDLAVEILSRSNTRAEMSEKLREYFAAGTRLAWFVDHRKGTIRVHTGPNDGVTLGIDDSLDGEPVLPGFRLKIRKLFECD